MRTDRSKRVDILEQTGVYILLFAVCLLYLRICNGDFPATVMWLVESVSRVESHQKLSFVLFVDT